MTALLCVVVYLFIGCCITPWYIRKIRVVHRAATRETISGKPVYITAGVVIVFWFLMTVFDLFTHFERWKGDIHEAVQED